METALNYTDKTLFFSSDERKWINRMRRLAAENPDEVTIMKQPEQNGGFIYCKMPSSYLKLSPKRKLTMTDEQKQIATERLRAMRKAQNVNA